MILATPVQPPPSTVAVPRRAPERQGQEAPLRPAMLIGRHDHAVAAEVRAAADAAKVPLLVEASVDDAITSLEAGGETPNVLLIALAGPNLGETVRAIQTHPRLRQAVVVGLAQNSDDVVFEEAFGAGIDECCYVDPSSLLRTLRAASKAVQARPRSRDEEVLVSHADASVRAAIGRVFDRAGFAVIFASTPAETEAAAAAEGKRLVIVSSDIASAAAGGAIAPWARRTNARAAWILYAPPPEHSALGQSLGDLQDLEIVVHDAFAAPSSLLFVANALRARHQPTQRKHPRMLYGTRVQVRAAGTMQRTTAYAYNISRGGLYLRTLSPPEPGQQLWLEFIPPRCGRHVHIEAKVVWRHTLDGSSDAVLPPGFGAQITGGSAADLAFFERGCAEYEAAHC